MSIFGLTSFIIVLAGFALAPAAGVEQAPPKELVQYVRDAAKLGLSDSQIRQNAVKAGWPDDSVTGAIAFAQATKETKKVPTANKENDKKDIGKKDIDAGNGTAADATPPIAAIAPAASPADPASPKERGVPEDYQIGAGDVLQISVWKEPEASVPRAVVRPDGKITLPLAKELSVIDMTPAEAEVLITSRLAEVISAADVTVIVQEIRSKKIYLVGAVKREGSLSYTYRMNIMQALSEAGGLTDYAKRKKIYVLRTEKGNDYRFTFDYDAVLRGERMELNIPLMAGDTIVVPH